MAVLQQLLASGDRAGFYMAYYAMTGSQEAALQAKISSFSDDAGGFAVLTPKKLMTDLIELRFSL